jgi:NADH:ubiquinone oxidoreductase subunit 5 (subunit L)/multisubunit Na+/H+ antiporter MnhA subunit
VTAVLAAVAAMTRPEVSAPFIAGAEIGLSVDALAALVLPTVGIVTFLVLVFAAGADVGGPTAGASPAGGTRARFHGLMLLFAAAATMTAAATTLPALLFAWEVMGATSYALIGFWWRDEPRVSAGLTAFLTTRTADLGLYVAAGAALAGGAGLALAALPEASTGWRHVIAAGILVAALGKAAQLPFSFWLSRAMEGPSPVSALLHRQRGADMTDMATELKQ